MNVSEFDYTLPNELIAQTPLPNRSDSKLLLLDKHHGTIRHDVFSNIGQYLQQGDVLVVNNTSVIPARLYGIKEETHATIEVLLLEQVEDDVWKCLTKKARRVKEHTTISFGDGRLKATCVKIKEEGIRYLKMEYDGVFYEILDELGEMPLPPYIHETLADPNRYQTVYNKHKGSAAAPTAGLHFTNTLLQSLKEQGVIIVPITLHVGLGTFRPVSVDNIHDHKMHSEFYHISNDTATILQQAKEEKRRIIAVGTTSLRTLETVYQKYKAFKQDDGWSDIFIYPGVHVDSIDGLITNFHLPKSTLLMLVSAIAGKERIFQAYNEAIQKSYRFFSFGDSMFIHP